MRETGVKKKDVIRLNSIDTKREKWDESEAHDWGWISKN
jgi:hypothetical protein